MDHGIIFSLRSCLKSLLLATNETNDVVDAMIAMVHDLFIINMGIFKIFNLLVFF